MGDKLPLGPYARDPRLVEHEEDHASFFGERCNPAVYIDRRPGGCVVTQWNSDPFGEPFHLFTDWSVRKALLATIGPPMEPVDS